MDQSTASVSKEWEDSTPFPDNPNLSGEAVFFQGWNTYDPTTHLWTRTDQRGPQSSPSNEPLSIATWNVDAFTRLSEARMQGVLDHLKSLERAPDVVFLQEVSKKGLRTVLSDPWVRKSFFTSERDASKYEGHFFMTMTLLSKARFAADDGSSLGPVGAVFRVDFPSRYDRDALCCDIFLPTPSSSSSGASSSDAAEAAQQTETVRVRLINVHLDSLGSFPSFRPRQLEMVTALLHSSGRGLVAGDFNPVRKEDATLVEENGLVDAWVDLHPEEAGFTWGLDGRGRPYPPCRMDKVVMYGGLKAQEIQVMHPGIIEEEKESAPKEDLQDGRSSPRDPMEIGSSDGSYEESDEEILKADLYWSDHSGLGCVFGMK